MSYRCRVINVMDRSDTNPIISVQMLDGELHDGVHECRVDLASGCLVLQVRLAMVFVRYLPDVPSQQNRFLTVVHPTIDCQTLVGRVLANEQPYQKKPLSPESLAIAEQAIDNAQRAIDEYDESMRAQMGDEAEN